jgi:hypothetical protein
MSALPSASWINESTPLWMRDGGTYSNLSISTITTTQITLDGQTLDATSDASGTLLLNGIAIATGATLTSSISNWARFPALSSITYTTSGGTGGLVNMNIGQFSTLQNSVGSISSLNVSSINGVSADATGGQIINSSNQYSFSTSNATPQTSPQQVAGVANGLFTLVTGKKYLLSVPVSGQVGSLDGVLYLSASLGTASSQTWPISFDTASSHTTGQFETKIIQGVVTATDSNAGLYLYMWRGSTEFTPNSSLQLIINPTSSGNFTNGGLTITTLT